MPALEKIVLVTRKTRLESLIERFNTLDQARFYIEHAGADFAVYQQEHDVYQTAVRFLNQQLQAMAKVHQIERGFLPNYLFTPRDLVVAVGQDGLVVNTAKYLEGQPLVAVNPDPDRFDGILLPYLPYQAPQAVAKVLDDKYRHKAITMAEARLADGQRLLAFNDLFIGPRSHTSARYEIRYAGMSEIHSSSGIIVSTGAGSTGWLSSVYNQAQGMQPMLLGATGAEAVMVQRNLSDAPSRFDWEEDRLRFVVREPFRSRHSGADLVFGDVLPAVPLELESRMPDEGVIFSDGVGADFLAFNSGAVATIGVSERKTRLVVPG